MAGQLKSVVNHIALASGGSLEFVVKLKPQNLTPDQLEMITQIVARAAVQVNALTLLSGLNGRNVAVELNAYSSMRGRMAVDITDDDLPGEVEE